MTQPISEGRTFVPDTSAVLADLGTRQRRIAAIHALAQFYTDHPDEPMPDYVMALTTSWPQQGDELDRVNAVIDFAKRRDAELAESWREVKARLNLLVQDGMDVRIVHSAVIDSNAIVNRYVTTADAS